MKKPIFRLVCGLISLLLPLSVPALTVVECVERDGSTWFRDLCPPEMTLKSTQELRGKPEEVEPSIEDIATDHPNVLFTAVNCEACTLVRDQLKNRGLPFTEKDSSQDPDTQTELAEVTGGPLTVPTITIGEFKFTGYNQKDIKSALDNAGYP